jgi:hypothetical protein
MGIREGSAGPFVVESQDVTVDVASIPAATAPDTAITVANARVGDSFIITPLGTWPVGVTLPQGRCLVAGTVQARIANVTVGAIDPGSQTFRVVIMHEVPGIS